MPRSYTRNPAGRAFIVALCIIAAGHLASACRQASADLSEYEPPDSNPRSNADGENWWTIMDTGPFLSDTVVEQTSGRTVALKGIAIRIGDHADASVVFDTEMLHLTAGFRGAVNPAGTPWDGDHNSNTYIAEEADIYFNNRGASPRLGWIVDGQTEEMRDFPAGPLPDEIAHYGGLYRHGRKTILHYTVGDTAVLDWPWFEAAGESGVITRTLNVGAAKNDLRLVLLDGADDSSATAVALQDTASLPTGVELVVDGSRLVLNIPRGTTAFHGKLIYGADRVDVDQLPPAEDLSRYTKGGPGIYPETVTVSGSLGDARQPYAVDSIPLPTDNPWHSEIRFGAVDFFADGKRLAASTWNGDVWIASGLDDELQQVTWKRYASGLFQTLGLKIVDEKIYTQGRDQITRLHDLNGDGEADYYENFNNDVMITEGFHEFTFDLVTDKDGNFYFSKGMPVQKGGRGFSPSTPHSGTVLKLSADGKTLEPIARGLRAPGGVGVSPDGIVTTGENEGSWVPRCKITWTEPGKTTFQGVVPSEWDGREFVETLPGSPETYDKPLVWLPYFVDNSSGSQLWVPEDVEFGPGMQGEMIHFSYGKASAYRVMREVVNGQAQGAVSRLPIDLTIATMRGRFQPRTGHLYVVGFRGWQTSGGTGLQRVRYTGEWTPQPTAVEAYENGMLLRFSAPLDEAAATDPNRFAVSKWKYLWTPQYGSGRFSIDNPDIEAERRAYLQPSKGEHNKIDTVSVGAAVVLDDGQSVFLYMPRMTRAMQMEIKLDLVDAMGNAFRDTIYNTIHEMHPPFEVAGIDFDDIEVVDRPPPGEPGLLFSFGGVNTDTLRTDSLAMTVPAGGSPSVFIDPKPFEGTFQGFLIVPERDNYRFSLEGIGTASFSLDSKELMAGRLPLEAGEAVSLNKGTYPITASYKSPTVVDTDESALSAGDARIRLMWESDRFVKEPVPPSAFRFLSDDNFEKWGRIRNGREVFADRRCAQCHLSDGRWGEHTMAEFLRGAPSIEMMSQHLSTGWLQRQVESPDFACPTVPEPDREDLIAYLLDDGNKHREEAVSPGDVETGDKLIDGLLMEHWLKPAVEQNRFTPSGLVSFLRSPPDYHRDTTFPDFRLDDDEANDVAAAAIARWGIAAHAVDVLGDVVGNSERGEEIYLRQCTACHEASSAEGAGSRVPLQDMFERSSDWTAAGCVANDPGTAPDLRLTGEERKALQAFSTADREAGRKSLSRFAPIEYAATHSQTLECRQCHTGANKLPAIDNAGAKLKTAWLDALLRGDVKDKTRPWLDSRMPAFPAYANRLANGISAMHGVDTEAAEPDFPDEYRTIGERLAGGGGFSCTLCHAAADQPALQAFEGQGPNLKLAAERLRYDYYQQWMHWPQRLLPLTIMPKYMADKTRSTLTTDETDTAHAQFAAIWHWMNGLAKEQDAAERQDDAR